VQSPARTPFPVLWELSALRHAVTWRLPPLRSFLRRRVPFLEQTFLLTNPWRSTRLLFPCVALPHALQPEGGRCPQRCVGTHPAWPRSRPRAPRSVPTLSGLCQRSAQTCVCAPIVFRNTGENLKCKTWCACSHRPTSTAGIHTRLCISASLPCS